MHVILIYDKPINVLQHIYFSYSKAKYGKIVKKNQLYFIHFVAQRNIPGHQVFHPLPYNKAPG